VNARLFQDVVEDKRPLCPLSSTTSVVVFCPLQNIGFLEGVKTTSIVVFCLIQSVVVGSSKIGVGSLWC